MNEQELINKALKALEINTAIIARGMKYKVPIPETHYFCDAELKLNDQEFAVEAKKNITNNNIGAAINQVKLIAKYKAPLLITDYINPNMADILKNEEVNFLDTVGNAFIKTKGTLVLIKGNKAPLKTTPKVRQAFTPTGLKIIYVFLVKQELLNAPYRDIAEAANVALGAVGWVIRDLKEQNYIVEGLNNKTRVWNINTKNQLIEKWVEHYPKLKAKNTLGQYTTINPDWWKKANIEKYRGLFAGEIAANKLTKYLKPQDHLIYLDKEKLNHFLKDFKLAAAKTDDKKNTTIEIIDIFWGGKLTETKDITHPLLTYADLIYTADVRNRETALIIKEQYFDW